MHDLYWIEKIRKHSHTISDKLRSHLLLLLHFFEFERRFFFCLPSLYGESFNDITNIKLQFSFLYSNHWYRPGGCGRRPRGSPPPFLYDDEWFDWGLEELWGRDEIELDFDAAFFASAFLKYPSNISKSLNSRLRNTYPLLLMRTLSCRGELEGCLYTKWKLPGSFGFKMNP